MTTRHAKKIAKASDQLHKSLPSIKLKDLQKFVDVVAQYIEESESEYFDFAKSVQLGSDPEGVVKFLVDTVAREPIAKKCVALEVIHNLLADPLTQEKFALHKLMMVLTSLLPSVNQEPLNQILGIQTLRVITYVAENDQAFLPPKSGDRRPSEHTKQVLDGVLELARSTKSEHEPLLLAIGAALMPFYLDGRFNRGDTWNNEPIKYLLMAAQSGKSRIHHEIGQNEISLDTEIFQSPLCKVYKGKWRGHNVAVKKFSQYSLGFCWEDFYKEVGLLSIAQHPNVVLFYGAYANNGKTEEPFIVLEYLSKGDLHDVVVDTFKKTNKRGFDYMRLVLMALDMAKGLAYLHQLGIIHRDIKTSNFLVADDDTVKMIDFGVSRVLSTSVIMTTVGTPTFMAPEVLEGKRYLGSADVYSFAMVMYECLVGQEPFEDVQSLQLAGKVIEGLRPPVPAGHAYTGYINIMRTCWDARPSKRPTFKQCVVQLYDLKREASAQALQAQQQQQQHRGSIAQEQHAARPQQQPSGSALFGTVNSNHASVTHPSYSTPPAYTTAPPAASSHPVS
eukprot:CAMPEP_0168603510 /NCGR_PEP_ID=MMETSP0420-20121227/14770_1 /TAXON_ID=498008 /ORGANISM="Pessonella sp." /LENGTH=560 /DNA_ID=CAMNT_0008642501 /DNA_START=17 /DNA_END=1696 /DNA_ORIENTATION=-